MKRILIALTALTLTLGTVQAASFNAQTEDVTLTLASWHADPSSAHAASYSHTSLSEVVNGYWQALHALGYQGNLTEASASSTTYLFKGASGTLEATFTLTGEQVSATVSPSETYS